MQNENNFLVQSWLAQKQEPACLRLDSKVRETHTSGLFIPLYFGASHSSCLYIPNSNTQKYKLRIIVFLSTKLLMYKTCVQTEKTRFFKRGVQKQNHHLLFLPPEIFSAAHKLVPILQGMLYSESKLYFLTIVICTNFIYIK